MSTSIPREPELVALARSASAAAYCPYSGFAVGAAVLSASGQLFSGCNVENASYGCTSCAERVAIGAMVSAGHRQLAAIAIYTPTSTPVSPCGACRQVLFEFGPRAWVVAASRGATLRTRVGDLLPDAFGPGSLTP